MFSLETPSRVLRRIEQLHLQAEDLDELPSLPNFDVTGSFDGSEFEGEQDSTEQLTQTIQADSAVSESDGDDSQTVTSPVPLAVTPSVRKPRPAVADYQKNPKYSSPQRQPLGISRLNNTSPSQYPVHSTPFVDSNDISSKFDESIQSIEFPVETPKLERTNLSESGLRSSDMSSFSNSDKYGRNSFLTEHTVTPGRGVAAAVREQQESRTPSRRGTPTRNLQESSSPISVSSRTSSPSTRISFASADTSEEPIRHSPPQTPLASPDAVARRKEYLLKTLKSTAKMPPSILKKTPMIKLTGLHTQNAPSQHPLAQVLHTSGSDNTVVDSPPRSPAHDLDLDNLELDLSVHDDDEVVSIATESSNDLTTYRAANSSLPIASLDGTGGVLGGPASVNRFNSAKLNSYLHTLNTNLGKENDRLLARIKELEDSIEEDRDANQVQNQLEDVLDEKHELEQTLRRQTAEYETLKARSVALDQEIRQLGDEIQVLHTHSNEKDVRIDELEFSASGAEKLREENQRIQSLLEESTSKLLAAMETNSSLERELNEERNIRRGLEVELSHLGSWKTKQKSPLANEVSLDSSEDNSVDKSLLTLDDNHQTELREAQARIKFLEDEVNDKNEIIQLLKSNKQENYGMQTPRRDITGDLSSVYYRSILGVKTPKSPGQIFGNLSSWSNKTGSPGNTTITPLLSKITGLEQIILDLRTELATTNEGIDSKINRINLKGLHGSLNLAQMQEKLQEALGQISSMEQLLENLSSELSNEAERNQELKQQLDERNYELDTLSNEKANLATTVRESKAELQRVKQEGERLAREYRSIKAEIGNVKARSKSEAVKIERLHKAEQRARDAEAQLDNHRCPDASEEIRSLKAQHKKQAKGMLVRIENLRQHTTRENDFRVSLAVQKKYLTNVIVLKQTTIDATLASFAALGLPAPITTEKRARRSFKSVARAVLAITIMKKMSESWKALNVPKMELRKVAYPGVRGRAFPVY